jgi:spore germination cell wall hydrolase CwlJ-like protein
LLCFHNAYAETDLECLSKNLYHEARDQGIEGLAAVAKVTKNRVKSPLFPDTICEVVWQRKQFSWTGNKNVEIKEKEVYKRIKNIAHLLLNYEIISPVQDSLYYHSDVIYGTDRKFEPYWAKYKAKVAKVGSHIFYKKEI